MSATRIGPYEVVRELGRGGMGVVLEVRHPDLPRRLALKLLSRDAASPEALERFSREARLLARVKHPHVVGVHTFASTDDGRPYLVTDLVEGATLKELARTAPFEPLRAARVVSALASALSALHAAGIVHRDLKPQNVILGADDAPVLLDFGLAREHDAQRLTQTGALLGTPAYMAPEQAAGDANAPLDARTDVYGLGAILFELLAGRPPFEGAPIQIVNAVLGRDPRWPDRADLPPGLAATLRKAMAKQPTLRHGTAAALGADLERIASGVALEPVRVGALPVVVALALAGVIGVAVARRPAAPPREPQREEPARVTTASVPAYEPEPAWDETEPVVTYREQLRWLADPKSQGHPRRERLATNLSRRRAQDLPLRTLISPTYGTGFPVVRFLTDERLLVIESAKTLEVVEVDRGRALAPIWTVQNTPLNAAITTRDGEVEVLVTAYASLYRARPPAPGAPAQPLAESLIFADRRVPSEVALPALAVSPDGRTAIVAGGYPYAHHVDLTVDPPRERRFGELRSRMNAIAFSLDGDWFVTGSEGPSMTNDRLVDQTIALWRADGERLDAELLLGTVRSIAVTSDGRVFAGTTFNAPWQIGTSNGELTPVRLAGDWNVPLVTARRSGRPLLYGVTAPPDGPRDLIVWDLADGRPRVARETSVGVGSVTSLDLSPDGTILALGRQLGTERSCVELWPAGDP